MSLVGSQGQDCSSVGVGIGQWRGWGVGRKPPEHGCSFKALSSLSSHHLPGQQRCQGKSKDRRLKGVGGWVPKAPGRVYSSGCLGRCTGRGTLSRQEEGRPSAKARGRSLVVLPAPPLPWGQGEAGRREARVTGQGLWGLLRVLGLDPAHSAVGALEGSGW